MKKFSLVLVLLFSSFAVAKSDFKWGPTLKIGAIHPVNLTLEARLGDYWSVGLGGGYLGVTVNSIETSITNGDLRIRFHPFKGAFFIGSAFGTQRIGGTLSKNIEVTVASVNVVVGTNFEIKVNSLYALPHLGWLWVADSGFLFGFEIGWQLNVSPSTSFNITTSNSVVASVLTQVQQTTEYQNAQSDVQKLGNDLGSTDIPYVGLLRFGWLF